MDIGNSAVEVIAQSLAGTIDNHRGRSVTEVTIDEQHLLFLDGERHRHVGCQVTLARTRIKRGKHDDILLGMGTDGELEVGAQYSERLVHDVALSCLHYYLAHLLRLLPEPDALLEGWAVLATHIVWNLAQERNIHVLQVLPATHGGIHALTHEDDDYRNEESQHEGYEHDVAAHRCHRLVVARRRGDDAGIVGGKCLGKLVLLALLEEEEIERLLDLLLATHSLQVLSLVRVAGNLGGSGSLVGLQGAQLGLEGYHEVVETGSDALSHGAKALVVVSHQRVQLT